MPTAKKKKEKVAEHCVAMQASDPQGEHHAVGIWHLHVLIVPDGRFWFAQGLEIDYAVQGNTVEDAKKQFENGLRATIHHHLQMFGTIDKLLKVAPDEEWRALWTTPKGQYKTYSQVSLHEIMQNVTMIDDFPFESIKYAEVRPAV